MMEGTELGWWGILVAVIGGAIRVSTPYLFVALGETLTEKSGRVNLGLEGILVFGAMSGYAIASITGNPWAGVLVAGFSGAVLALMHALTCSLPRVNDIAVGISLFILGSGLAFFFGKDYISLTAPRLPHLELGFWSDSPQIRSALEVNALFIIGVILAFVISWALKNTKWGLVLRTVGDSSEAARALGYRVNVVRTIGTVAGGFLGGVGGSFLSLYYPGTWNEGLSSGQGLMAVALVIFARWDPKNCLYVSLLFGGATSIGPALQTVGVTTGYYLFGAAPYFLTLVLLIYSSSKHTALVGAPGEVSINR